MHMANVAVTADFDELRRFDLFSSFTDDDLHRLLRRSVRKAYRRGTVLFEQGDPADRFFLVVSGRVKLIQRSENGDEVIVEIFGPGQSLGEAAMLTRRPFPVGAELLANSRLIQVSAEPFLSELAKAPDLAFKVVANLARLHRRLIRQLGELRHKSPRQRVASYLLSLTPATEGQAVVRLPDDKGVIASRIGISAESLSRTLFRLRDNGVRCRGREVEMNDVMALHQFCANEYYVAGSPCGAIGACAARAHRATAAER